MKYSCLLGCLMMFTCYFEQCYKTTCTITDIKSYGSTGGLAPHDEWLNTCVAPNGYNFVRTFPWAYEIGTKLCINFRAPDYYGFVSWAPMDCEEF